MIFIEVKALSGANYVRAGEVLAVQTLDAKRCAVIVQGGVSVSCNEPAADVVARLEAALGAALEKDNRQTA